MKSSKLDPSELKNALNLPTKRAIEIARELGFVVRFVEVDGEPYSMESRHDVGRANFKIQDGIVIEVGVG